MGLAQQRRRIGSNGPPHQATFTTTRNKLLTIGTITQRMNPAFMPLSNGFLSAWNTPQLQRRILGCAYGLLTIWRDPTCDQGAVVFPLMNHMRLGDIDGKIHARLALSKQGQRLDLQSATRVHRPQSIASNRPLRPGDKYETGLHDRLAHRPLRSPHRSSCQRLPL